MQVARSQLLDLKNYGLRDRNYCRLKFLTLIIFTFDRFVSFFRSLQFSAETHPTRRREYKRWSPASAKEQKASQQCSPGLSQIPKLHDSFHSAGDWDGGEGASVWMEKDGWCQARGGCQWSLHSCWHPISLRLCRLRRTGTKLLQFYVECQLGRTSPHTEPEQLLHGQRTNAFITAQRLGTVAERQR